MNTKYLFTNINNYSPSISNLDINTPLSKQSKKYKKYQEKLVLNNSFFKEGFSNLSENNNINSLSSQIKSVLSESTPSSTQTQSNQELKTNYQNTLVNYQTLVAETLTLMKKHSQSVNSDINPYLGKNVQFSDGTVAYVTNVGVVKPYSMDVYNSNVGKNGCPSNSPIAVNMPWSSSYLTPNTVISSEHSLVSGSIMKSGQSCGNEGNNIMVDSLVNENTTPSVSYQGCYKDSITSPVMSYLSPISTSDPSLNQIYSFEDCKKSASLNNYSYFGLQDVNPTTNLGICALSNDLSTATSLGKSDFTQTSSSQLEPITLWSSGTTNGASATLTSCGQIQVMDTAGNIIFSTPETINTSNYSPGDIYYTFQAPSCNPLSPNANTAPVQYEGNYRLNIGNQLTMWYSTGVEWWPTEVGGVSYPAYGYQVTTSGSNFVYDGAYNVLNSTYPNLFPNQSFIATKGKTGVNSMIYGTVLNQGEFIGNPDGSLYLLMDTDGNLKLNTSKFMEGSAKIPNCTKLFNSEYYGGNASTNAIYNVGPIGNKSMVNSVYYVSPDAELYTFHSTDLGLSTNYTTFSNYNTPNNDISSSIGISLEDCQTDCNNNSSCAGIVYNSTSQSCSLKNNNMWPNDNGIAISDKNSSIYLKKQAISKAPLGIPKTTSSIDSITASNYGPVKGNVFESSKEKLLVQNQIAIRNNMTNLKQIENKLNSLAEQLSDNNISVEDNYKKIYNQSVKDRNALTAFFNEYQEILNNIENMNEKNGILKDSQIIVSQKNYSYIMWSVVAISIILFTISVLKKN